LLGIYSVGFAKDDLVVSPTRSSTRCNDSVVYLSLCSAAQIGSVNSLVQREEVSMNVPRRHRWLVLGGAIAGVVLFELIVFLLYFFADVGSFLVIHKVLPLIVGVPILALLGGLAVQMSGKGWLHGILIDLIVVSAFCCCVPAEFLAATDFLSGGTCLKSYTTSGTPFAVSSTTCAQPTSVYVRKRDGLLTRQWLVAECRSKDWHNYEVGPRITATWRSHHTFELEDYQGAVIDMFTINPDNGKPDHTLKKDHCPPGGSG
jgi:hypothetical protein